MNKYYFAVDLGASSGRTMIARIDSGKIEMEEINRFPNHIIETVGHCYWDILELYRNILDGLKKVAARKDVELASIGIDTWGVDFVLVGKDGHLLGYPYSYRDLHTAAAPEKYFSRVSREDVYKKTGIQVMNFNSLFQFDKLSRAEDSAWKVADKILFMPDALGYMLTGKAVTEYTIASTAQIVNAGRRCLDRDILGNEVRNIRFPGTENRDIDSGGPAAFRTRPCSGSGSGRTRHSVGSSRNTGIDRKLRIPEQRNLVPYGSRN